MMTKIFRIRRTISKKLYIVLAISAFVLLVAAWFILSAGGIVKPTILPSPIDVVQYTMQSAIDGSLWSDVGVSVVRILSGFLLACVVGIPIGIICGTFKALEAFIRPLCEFIRYLPVPALVPLIMVWFGIGEEAKIAVIFIGTLFQMIPMVADAVMDVPSDLINAAYTLGAGRWKVIMRVIVPAVLPKLFEIMRMMIGWAWTYLVVAELVAASSGLGYSILKAQRVLKTQAIFSGILVIGLLGILTDRLFALMIKKFFSWEEGAK